MQTSSSSGLHQHFGLPDQSTSSSACLVLGSRPLIQTRFIPLLYHAHKALDRYEWVNLIIMTIKGQNLIKPSHFHPLRCYKLRDKSRKFSKLDGILHYIYAPNHSQLSKFLLFLSLNCNWVEFGS